MKAVKILVIGTVFGLWSLIFGFSSSANSFLNSVPSHKIEKPKTETPDPITEKSARELYAQNCARCHGADGRGKTELGETFDVPDIADAGWQKRHSNAKISKTIARGGGGMPAFAKKLTAKEIASLVTYVRTLNK